MDIEEIPFNKQLRHVTREIHTISDVLINGKLALGWWILYTKHTLFI